MLIRFDNPAQTHYNCIYKSIKVSRYETGYQYSIGKRYFRNIG